jgi:hypothetical protein
LIDKARGISEGNVPSISPLGYAIEFEQPSGALPNILEFPSKARDRALLDGMMPIRESAAYDDPCTLGGHKVTGLFVGGFREIAKMLCVSPHQSGLPNNRAEGHYQSPNLPALGPCYELVNPLWSIAALLSFVSGIVVIVNSYRVRAVVVGFLLLLLGGGFLPGGRATYCEGEQHSDNCQPFQHDSEIVPVSPEPVDFKLGHCRDVGEGRGRMG